MEKKGDFGLEHPMMIAGRTHEDLAPFIQLNLKGKILKKRIVENACPLHNSPLYGEMNDIVYGLERISSEKAIFA